METSYIPNKNLKINGILVRYKVKKSFKLLYTKIAFVVLAAILKFLSKHDKDIKREVEAWEDSFSFTIKVLNQNLCMSMEKKNGALKYMGSTEKSTTLTIYIKNLDSAFLILFFKISLCQALAEHRVSSKGNISKGMSLNRCLSKLQGYILK